jgi:hypothetical protein
VSDLGRHCDSELQINGGTARPNVVSGCNVAGLKTGSSDRSRCSRGIATEPFSAVAQFEAPRRLQSRDDSGGPSGGIGRLPAIELESDRTMSGVHVKGEQRGY